MSRQPYSVTPQQLASLPSTQRINLEAVVERLDSYVTNMSGARPIDPRDGGGYQTALWNCLRQVLNADAQQFSLQWSEVLATFHKHRRDAFDERMLYRFFGDMRITGANQRSFERILGLITRTADPATRAMAYKQVDIRSIMASLENEAITEKVNAYYQML